RRRARRDTRRGRHAASDVGTAPRDRGPTPTVRLESRRARRLESPPSRTDSTSWESVQVHAGELRDRKPRRSRRAQHGELIRDLELWRPEAEERARPAAGGTGRTLPAGGLEHLTTQEHTLEVRRGDVVPESRRVEISQLGDGELVGPEREAKVRVRKLGAQPLSSGQHDRPVVERERGEVVDRMPVGVARKLGIDVARDEAEVSGRELPLARGALRIAQRLELLEMRKLTHVDLFGEVAADRLLERVLLCEIATR